MADRRYFGQKTVDEVTSAVCLFHHAARIRRKGRELACSSLRNILAFQSSHLKIINWRLYQDTRVCGRVATATGYIPLRKTA